MKKITLIFIALLISFPAYAGKKKQREAQATHAQIMNYYHRMCGNDEDVEMYIGTTAEEVKRTCRKIAYYVYLNNKKSRKVKSVRGKRKVYRKKRYRRKK